MNTFHIYESMLFECDCIPLWIYDCAGILAETTLAKSIDRDTYQRILEQSIFFRQYVAESPAERVPSLIYNSFGMVWGLMPTADSFHVIGPVFHQDHTTTEIHEMLRSWEHNVGSLSGMIQLQKILSRLPICSSHRIQMHMVYLYWLLNAEHITYSQIRTVQTNPAFTAMSQAPDPAETAAVKDAWQNVSNALHLGQPVNKKDLASIVYSKTLIDTGSASLEDMKTRACLVIDRCVIAAFTSDISSESIQSMEHNYLRSILAAENYNSLLNNLTYCCNLICDERSRREHSGYDSDIIRGMDYIRLHIHEDIRLDSIADSLGYTTYYYSRKFAAATGTTLADYIHRSKIDASKAMLLDPDTSIQEIADAYSFSTRAYYSSQFRKYTGMTPSGFRNSPQL